MNEEEYKRLLENLEINREKIIQEQKEYPKLKNEREKKEIEEWANGFEEFLKSHKKQDIKLLKGEPQIQLSEEGIFCVWNKEIFLFDKEGFELFQQQFCVPDYELVKGITKSGNYLARRKFGEINCEFFHRWFMHKEVFNFRKDNYLEGSEIVVHHKNFNTSINTRDNLQVMTRKEHDLLHNRETKEEKY